MNASLPASAAKIFCWRVHTVHTRVHTVHTRAGVRARGRRLEGDLGMPTHLAINQAQNEAKQGQQQQPLSPILPPPVFGRLSCSLGSSLGVLGSSLGMLGPWSYWLTPWCIGYCPRVPSARFFSFHRLLRSAPFPIIKTTSCLRSNDFALVGWARQAAPQSPPPLQDTTQYTAAA